MDDRNLLRGGIKKDEDTTKRFPNGIAAVFRSVFRYWLLEEGDVTPTTAEVFARDSSFSQSYKAYFSRYPGAITGKTTGYRRDEDGQPYVDPSAKNLSDMLKDIGNQSTPLDYPRLRALSDYLEVPDAVVLIAAKLVSIQRRAIDPKEASVAQSQYLNGLFAVIDAAIRVATSENASFSDIEPGSDESVWLADAEVLRLLFDAYKRSHLDTLKILETRR